MTTFRRIVFGEPQPGGFQFAKILSVLDESVSYCNRIGPLEHDRVTDLPFAVPALGLNFVHPTPLQFISAAPPPNDSFGIFAYHHIALYGAAKYPTETHWRCAQLCEQIYKIDPLTVWDERIETAGVVWGLRVYGKTAYVVFRGSKSPLDWIRDLAGFDPPNLDPTFGPMWGGFLIGMAESWAAIRPLLVGMDELIFTGHSLGAARAGIAAAFALAEYVKPH